MNAIGYTVLIGWIPAVMVLFMMLPARRAVIVAVVTAWLFLPNAKLPLPGLPDYTKTSATSVGLLICVALFDGGRLSGMRLRWFDLPILVWCLSPLASSLANNLGVYDGLSVSLAQTITWGLPYLIGRAYFCDLDGLRELAIGISVGGLIYMPLCLWEIRMSPMLSSQIYGVARTGARARYGGYRPNVFMKDGLEVGMWMTAACLSSYWLWATGAVRRLWGLPFGGLLLGLLVTTVLCKTTGALILLAVGLVLLWAVTRSKLSILVWVLVLTGPSYMLARSTNLWSGESAVAMASSWINPERAASFAFRLRNEDMLTARALQRPVFGWGGWKRNQVLNEKGKSLAVIDGLWVDALGKFGLVGLSSLTAAMLLPLTLLTLRYRVRSWRIPDLAPAAVLSVLLGLYMIDCLMNGMINLVYLVAIGGMTAFVGRGRVAVSAEDPGYVGDLGAIEAGTWSPDSWAGRVAVSPEHETWRGELDAQNDLAWSLINAPAPGPSDPTMATRLAENAVSLAPECGSYWNTLGVAYYRLGDWEGAIRALERSVELNDGGTSFDFYFLAMAHWQRGDRRLAREWCDRAEEWTVGYCPDHPELYVFDAEAAALLGRAHSRQSSP